MSNKYIEYIEAPTTSINITPRVTQQTIDVKYTKTAIAEPIYAEVDTSAGMDATLVAENEGKMYKYTGTTDTNYTNGRLYVVCYCVVIPTVTGNFTYTGSEQSPTITGYDASVMTQTGTATATDAGTYTLTYTLNSGLVWTDGTASPKSFTWTIAKASIGAKPITPSEVTYDGNVHTNGYTTPAHVTMTGNNSGTNAGTYTATYTPNNNYCWSDNTSNAVSISLVINKAAGTLSISPTSVTFTRSVLTNTVTVTSNCLGTINCSALSGVSTSISSNIITITGDGTTVISGGSIIVSVTPDANHTTPTSVTITVNASYELTDLTGTIWTVDPSAETGTGVTYNVTISAPPGTATAFIAPLKSFKCWDYDTEAYNYNYYYCEFSDEGVRYAQDADGNELESYYEDDKWTYYSSGGVMETHTLEFTGGTDVTNTTLINWLKANATMEE